MKKIENKTLYISWLCEGDFIRFTYSEENSGGLLPINTAMFDGWFDDACTRAMVSDINGEPDTYDILDVDKMEFYIGPDDQTEEEFYKERIPS